LDGTNRVAISGTLLELGALRHTPAGVAAIEFRLLHQSSAVEAGVPRSVRAEVPAIAFEVQARMLAGAVLNSALEIEGFLCARSKRSAKLVLHVTRLEFTQGEK
jgi:primosomal replication protein N